MGSQRPRPEGRASALGIRMKPPASGGNAASTFGGVPHVGWSGRPHTGISVGRPDRAMDKAFAPPPSRGTFGARPRTETGRQHDRPASRLRRHCLQEKRVHGPMGRRGEKDGRVPVRRDPDPSGECVSKCGRGSGHAILLAVSTEADGGAPTPTPRARRNKHRAASGGPESALRPPRPSAASLTPSAW